MILVTDETRIEYRFLKLKTVATIFLLVLAFGLSGCKPKENESVTSNKVTQPEDKLINGQIFIVTKSGENVPLGDVEVALFDQQQMWACFNSYALKWSNSLAEAQIKVDQATTNYDALYKDDIDKFGDYPLTPRKRIF